MGGQAARCRMFAVSLLAIAIFNSAFYSSAQESPADCDESLYPITKIGVRSVVNAVEGSFPLNQNTRIVPARRAKSSDKARYVRVLIELLSPGDCDWYITIRDESYHVIQTLVRRDFVLTRVRWSQRVPGSRAVINFQRCKSKRPPKIQIKEIIEMPEKAENTYYSSKTPGVPDWRNLYEDLDYARTKPSGDYRSAGDYVGFVMSSAGGHSWVCSGVMVAKDIILTNWHCGAPDSSFPETDYWNKQIVKDTIIDLSFDEDANSREYMGIELLAKDIENDFAFLRIAPINTRDTPRPAPISLAKLKAGDGIQIIHHPSGEQKRISYDCTVLDPQYPSWKNSKVKSEFTHRCDTERGSSGAPVFNLQGQLVGMHHLGHERKGNLDCDRRNKAIWINSIIDGLRRKRPDIIRELQLVN